MAKDGLFLLEVLVDKIKFLKSPCFSDKEFRTCITIKCSTMEPIEICDDDPTRCAAQSGGAFFKTFNIGKSCLFSLQEKDIQAAMNSFPVTVTVSKSLPCGCLPTKIILGEAVIDMTKEFVQSRNKQLTDPGSPNYEALKDNFHLISPDKAEAAEISMLMRISSFGSLIVTRFQGTGSPTLGLRTPVGTTDSCDPPRQYQSLEQPCSCHHTGRSLMAPPCTAGTGPGTCPPARDMYSRMPCEEPVDPCYCSGPIRPPIRVPMSCRNTDPYCLHLPKDCCPAYGNKVIFQLPSDSCKLGHKHRAHYNLTSDGVGDLVREEPGKFVNPTAENYPGVKYDYSTNILRMRISKTVEWPGRSTKMEYNFVTPVYQEKKKVVQTRDTRGAQCECPRCCDGCN